MLNKDFRLYCKQIKVYLSLARSCVHVDGTLAFYKKGLRNKLFIWNIYITPDATSKILSKLC